MKIFNRFSTLYARFKAHSQWKDHAASSAIGQLLSDQMTHNQAPNYIEMTFGSDDGRQFVVTVRRHEGDTPHQLRKFAEAEASELLQVQGRLTDALRDLIQAAKDNSGTDSLGVFHRELDRASELLAKLNGGE